MERLGFTHLEESGGTRVGGVLRPRGPVMVRESGTTLRLLLPLAASSSAPVEFRLGPRLGQRPLQPLVEALRQLGATVEVGGDKIRVGGGLKGGACRLRVDESSQFLSGLLLAAPLLPGSTTIQLEGTPVSRPYVELTLSMMRERGVRVDTAPDGAIHVPGNQRYRQRTYEVPGDWSSAAALFATAATTAGCVNVEGLPLKERGGDARILEHLDAFGACVEITPAYVSVAGCKLEAAAVDLRDQPDLFPSLAAVAALAPGNSTITGAPHLRGKESDRIEAMTYNLRALGIDAQPLPDGLRVTGRRPTGGIIDPHGDHRIAMAMAAVALAARPGFTTSMRDPDVVRKSYPAFWQDLERLAPGSMRHE